MSKPTDIAEPADVLRFWFGAFPLAEEAMLRVGAQWFTKDAAFDAALRSRFGSTILAALAGGLGNWSDDVPGCLAHIVVLDQFTRNVFRGFPASFAGDLQALVLAEQALQRGDDQALPPLARTFCYLPLEHAEDLALQDRSVALFDALASAGSEASTPMLVRAADYAHRHRDVVREYGRFPHRNAILGRESTPQELAYLAQPGAGF